MFTDVETTISAGASLDLVLDRAGDVYYVDPTGNLVKTMAHADETPQTIADFSTIDTAQQTLSPSTP